MTITLRPEHERLVTKALETGAYKDPDEVIGRALEMLHSEAEWLQDHKEQIAEKIERAFGQFELGEYRSAEQSREELNRRKTAWLNEHKR